MTNIPIHSWEIIFNTGSLVTSHVLKCRVYSLSLYCIKPFFTRTDPKCFVNWKDENFSVPYLSCCCCLLQDICDCLNVIFTNNNFQLYFGCKFNCVFVTAIELCMPTTSTKTTHFRDSHPFNTNLCQCVFDLFKFKKWINCCGIGLGGNDVPTDTLMTMLFSSNQLLNYLQKLPPIGNLDHRTGC